MKNSMFGQFIFAALFCLTVFTNCQKNNDLVGPSNAEIGTISTGMLAQIDVTSAVMKSKNSFSEATEMGHVWSDKTDKPIVLDGLTASKAEMGAYQQTLKPLKANTVYTVRAFVVVNGEYIYADAVSFKTLEAPIKVREK